MKKKKSSFEKIADQREYEFKKIKIAKSKFEKQMLVFLKTEQGLRQFEDVSELTFLGKNIETLEEFVVKMDEWQDQFNER